MARRLSYSARYSHPVEKLYEAQSTKQYWDDMMAGFQMISPHCEVEDFRSDETGLRVVLKPVSYTHLTLPTKRIV